MAACACRVTRVEPKVYLANERTFINWLTMAVKIGSVASALVGEKRLHAGLVLRVGCPCARAVGLECARASAPLHAAAMACC